MMSKYRAWLKDVGEMVEVLEIDFYNKEVAYIWTEQVSDYELEQTREVDKFGDVILMQSTGLKDKNGVEIYEGDIVKGSYYWRGKGEFNTGEGHYPIHAVVQRDEYSTALTADGFDIGRIAEHVECISNLYLEPDWRKKEVAE